MGHHNREKRSIVEISGSGNNRLTYRHKPLYGSKYLK